MDITKLPKNREVSFYRNFPLVYTNYFIVVWYWRKYRIPPYALINTGWKRFGKLPMYYGKLSGDIFYHPDGYGESLEFQKRFLQ